MTPLPDGGWEIREEPEWDGPEREWMLALADYEASLCPDCGLPMSECHNPQAQFRFDATARVCWVTAKQQQAVSQWREDHANDPTDWSGALTTHTIARPH